MFGLFRSKARYLADIEYWVYLPDTNLPVQDELMDFVLRGHEPSLTPPTAGPPEGILFSDVRLNVALVLRSKNPHVFRPDLITQGVELTAESLEALAASKALVKVRYTSEEPLNDRRHLKLIPCLAMAAGVLGGSSLVFDARASVLWPFAEFRQKVLTNPVAPQFHVRAVWKPVQTGGGVVESLGLLKVGVRDFQTKEMNADEQVLVLEVVEQAALILFEAGAYPDDVTVTAFDDSFKLAFDQRSKGPVQASLMRLRTV